MGIAVVTIVRLTPGHDRSRSLPPPDPAFTLPGTLSGPPAPVSLLPSGPLPSGPLPSGPLPRRSASRSLVEKAETSPARSNPRVPVVISAPRTVSVSGRYRVLNSYPDSFIGEVSLTNRTSAPQDWVVTLTYPGTLRTSWLESLPQPTLVQRGHTFVWTSSVPLAAASTADLKFHFDLAGAAERPSSCSVNGVPCS